MKHLILLSVFSTEHKQKIEAFKIYMSNKIEI